MSKLLLSLTCLLAIVVAINAECKAQHSKKRMVCYFTNWAQYRSGNAKMLPKDLDPCLCTHVLFAFVPIQNNAITPTANDMELFNKMKEWKNVNPNIKLMFSVGGANDNSKFPSLVENDANRGQFCQSVIDLSVKYGFDGVDIDWEFPAAHFKTTYTDLVKKCHDMFSAQAQQSGQPKYLLSAATAPDVARMGAYDLPMLNKYFDFINPMTYDWHGSWDANRAHHSPLNAGTEGASHTILDLYIKGGFSPSKINYGLAAYGKTASASGPYTNQAGMMGFFEVCEGICKKEWTDSYDPTVVGSKAVNPNGHIYYDNVMSVTEKIKWANENDLGGAFIWDTSFDDFSGTFCCQGKFPLISSALNVLTTGSNSISADPCCRGGPTTTARPGPTYPQPSTKARPSPKYPQPAPKVRPGPTYSTYPRPRMSTTTATNAPMSSECRENAPVYSCTMFTALCRDGVPTYMACPAGLLYNEPIKICDWPSNVNCNVA